MRVLIKQSKNPSVNHFFSGIARTLVKSGAADPTQWNSALKPSFDAFDELRPDIFLASEHDLTHSDMKCLNEYKGTLFIHHQKVDDNESRWNLAAYGAKPDLEFSFSKQTNVCIPCAMDILDMSRPNLDSLFSISCVATKEKYNQYLIDLCSAKTNANLAVFSNEDLGIAEYFGPPTNMASIYSRAYLSIIFGDNKYESNHRLYDCIKYSGLPLVEYNETDQNILQSTFPAFIDQSDITKWLKYYQDFPRLREKTIKTLSAQCFEHHTYFERAYDLFTGLGLTEVAEKIRNSK